jgi:hypothetical protein
MSQSPHPRPLWRVSSHPRWCPVRSVSGGTPVGQINPRPRDDFLEAMGSGWWVAAHLFAVFGFILVALGVMAIWDLVRDTREISVSGAVGSTGTVLFTSACTRSSLCCEIDPWGDRMPCRWWGECPRFGEKLGDVPYQLVGDDDGRVFSAGLHSRLLK